MESSAGINDVSYRHIIIQLQGGHRVDIGWRQGGKRWRQSG